MFEVQSARHPQMGADLFRGERVKVIIVHPGGEISQELRVRLGTERRNSLFQFCADHESLISILVRVTLRLISSVQSTRFDIGSSSTQNSVWTARVEN